MEDAVTEPTLPVLDEHDANAIEALLIRQVRAQDERDRDRKQVEALNARIAENTRLTNGIYTALTAIYGFVEPDDDDRNKWDLVRDALGIARYDRAMDIARGSEPPPLLAKMSHGHDSPQTESGAGGASDSVVRNPPAPIRTIILEFLHAAGDRGIKASEAREHLLGAHGITVHEKTPGMTLYRLLKDGLARREGRTWYAVQQESNENEAPNGRAAGASETALAAQ